MNSPASIIQLTFKMDIASRSLLRTFYASTEGIIDITFFIINSSAFFAVTISSQ